MPKTCIIFLGKLFPSFFLSQERIIRLIYSEFNINPRNKKLRRSFVQFRPNTKTEKVELSCVRFEFEEIENCKIIGKSSEDPKFKRNFYGLGCTSVFLIKTFKEHKLAFTPVLGNDKLQNPFHTDVINTDLIPVKGIAATAEENFYKDNFIKIWKVYEESELTSHESVISGTLE